MLYEEKDLALSLLNVFTFSRSDSVVQERPRNFHALSIRTGGSGRFEYDNRSFSVNRGEIVYVPAGRGYRVSAEYEEIIVLHFQLWNYRSLEIQPFVPADSAACEALFRRILAEWERRRAGSGYRCTAMAYELLAQLQIQAAEARCAEGALRKIRPSMECLERRLLDPELTVEDLAACSAMSSVYFRRLFREAVSYTHLDVYKRQVEKTCLNDIQSLSASEAQVGLPFLSDLSFHDSGTDGSYFIGGFP